MTGFFTGIGEMLDELAAWLGDPLHFDALGGFSLILVAVVVVICLWWFFGPPRRRSREG